MTEFLGLNHFPAIRIKADYITSIDGKNRSQRNCQYDQKSNQTIQDPDRYVLTSINSTAKPSFLW